MSVLYEWNFHNRVCRVVESEPGIVHFEEASRTTGDPSVMLFNWTTSPAGAANEIIQLSMALAEANVINRDLSASIAKWQEEHNRREQEIAALRARVEELERMVPKWVGTKRAYELGPQGWTDAAHYGPDLRLMVPPIPLPEKGSE